eukprot:6173200-Pleurochrysis_carterae.AAC.6
MPYPMPHFTLVQDDCRHTVCVALARTGGCVERPTREPCRCLAVCSGQEVLDPRDLMKRARDEHGAESAEEWKAGQAAGSSAFTGAGQSLNGATTAGEQRPERAQEHTITFWQNGFTVDDGERRFRSMPPRCAHTQ